MCDIGTPPKPSTNTEKQHPHPRDESPVYAGEGNGQESIVMEKGKKKKKWWKVTNFFRSLRKQLKGSSNSVQVEVEQPQKQQESEQVKPQNECKARCSDDYTVNHNQLDDQLCECVLGAEAKRLEDDPEVSVEHLNKTDEDVEGIYVLEYPQPLPEDIALNILANRGPDSHVCESKVEEKVKEKKKKKKKKKWWKLTSLFRACKKHRKSSSNPVEGELPEEQEQQIEEVKPQIECKARCSDDYTVNHNQLNDQLSKCGLGAEVRRLEDGLEDDPEVSVEHLNKTDEDVEGIYILGYPHRLPEDIALNILEKRGPDSHVCDLSTPPKPSINVEEKHSHPHNETPVDAVEGNGRESKVEEKAKETRKKKKKWWRLTSFFRTIKNLGMSSTNPVEDEAELPEEQPQEQEVQEQQNVEEKSDKKWKARCSDGVEQEQLEQQNEEVRPQKERKAKCGDLLCQGGFSAAYEARRQRQPQSGRLGGSLNESLACKIMRHVTRVSVEHLNKTDEDVEGICTVTWISTPLNILDKRGPGSYVCDLSTPPKLTILEEQDSHAHNETPVDASEGNGQETLFLCGPELTVIPKQSALIQRVWGLERSSARERVLPQAHAGPVWRHAIGPAHPHQKPSAWGPFSGTPPSTHLLNPGTLSSPDACMMDWSVLMGLQLIAQDKTGPLRGGQLFRLRRPWFLMVSNRISGACGSSFSVRICQYYHSDATSGVL
ncbi:hypothetical protein Q8A67_012258 [Cirrhinus molitorella]|uniref:Uncharacterized protein n=1 Tax=Cirrhinus molitorella TaxID=172907 RepID=A0AA88PLV9_9TELE|nr:hypothetical protein Q8A67_012258 [Cirrhinus molitorella]